MALREESQKCDIVTFAPSVDAQIDTPSRAFATSDSALG